MSRRALVSLAFAVLVAAATALGACGPQFEPANKVTQIRILAASADKPYAKPGETVTLELLAYDGRAEQPEPMQLFWLPFVCVNPPQDLYYACFIALGGSDAGARAVGGGDAAISGDAGGDAGGRGSASDILGRFPPGTDLTPFLPKGPKFSFKMPENVIETHPPIPGTSIPYGMAIVFNIACAGRVVLAATDPSQGPQQVPLQCVGKNGEPAPPADYVLGFTRVYSYTDEPNTNPVIDRVTFDGQDIDPAKGIVVQKCVAKTTRECEEHTLDTVIKPEGWEVSRVGVEPGGAPRRELIWVAYYMTTGDVKESARLLYDVDQGFVGQTETKFQAPAVTTEGVLWAVVRDNRGGTTWRQMPLKVVDEPPPKPPAQ